ncbi:E3 ubiquitin-protein ligase MARCHF4 [Linum perenne]
MGDHFVLLVDRLLTESSLEAAIESNNQLHQAATTSSSKDSSGEFLRHRMELDYIPSPKKMVDCRICHDEDEDTKMEVPCSCNGSLKYAHRKCIQRWCNEKGDTICEICHQQYKPGYTAPTPLFHYGGNWDISTNDYLHNPQFIAMVSDDNEPLDSDFDDYSSPSPRSLLCCRIVAVIFMVLLVLRHTLPIIVTGAEDYSLTMFTLLMLRTIGILLPIYVMVKAFTAIQRRRNRYQQMALMESDEENELPRLPPQSRLIHVR